MRHLNVAERYFLHAVRHEGDNPEYLSALGALRANLAKEFPVESADYKRCFQEAVRTLTTVIERWPDYALARYRLGKVHLDLGELELAAKHLEYLVGILGKAVSTPDLRRCFNHSRIYSAFNVEWEKAAVNSIDLDESVSKEHRSLLQWSVWCSLGTIYRRLGLEQPALRAYSDAISARPELGQAYTARAELREEVGDLDGAVADYYGAANRELFNVVASRGVMRTLSRLGRVAELGAFREECITLIDACPNYTGYRHEFMAVT